MPKVLEIARFKVDPAKKDDFLAARPAMEKAIKQKFPELQALYLMHLENDIWVDVAVWETPEAAAAAVQQACSIDEVKRWMSIIDEDLSMEHGEIIEFP